MEFIAEITQTKQRKLVSLDNQYELKLVTDDPNIMDLGKLPPDVLVKVKVEIYDEARERNKKPKN